MRLTPLFAAAACAMLVAGCAHDGRGPHDRRLIRDDRYDRRYDRRDDRRDDRWRDQDRRDDRWRDGDQRPRY